MKRIVTRQHFHSFELYPGVFSILRAFVRRNRLRREWMSFVLKIKLCFCLEYQY